MEEGSMSTNKTYEIGDKVWCLGGEWFVRDVRREDDGQHVYVCCDRLEEPNHWRHAGNVLPAPPEVPAPDELLVVVKDGRDIAIATERMLRLGLAEGYNVVRYVRAREGK